ncbi:MAG TPA: M28 family peptidase [Edaphocola sp.]|nr:M28 family peptidase [Edaphocola sp.]
MKFKIMIGIKRLTIGSLLIVLYSQFSYGQGLKNIINFVGNRDPEAAKEIASSQLQNEVKELISTKYSGRKLGTVAYKNLTFYLEQKMLQLGLERYGSIGYRTPFKYPNGRQLSHDAKFYLNGKSLFIGKEVLPLPFSAAKENDGFFIPGNNQSYSPWTVELPTKKYSEDNILPILKNEIINAQSRGATALYFYDNSGTIDLPNFKFNSNVLQDEAINIPVWIISKFTWETYFKNVNSIINVASVARYSTVYDEAFNVVGLINNKAEKTVVIFTNYDQVSPDAIQGASFNAGSVALLMQLATVLKASEYKKYNYAIAAFSGSSIGDLGAKTFLSVPGIKEKIAYALSLNGLGNFNSKNNIYINGIGSSIVFKSSILHLTNTAFQPKVGEELPVGKEYKVFLNNEIPTLSLSSNFDSYNAQKDNFVNMNFTGLTNSISYISHLISNINKSDLNIKYKYPNLVIKDEDIVAPTINIVKANKVTKENKTKTIALQKTNSAKPINTAKTSQTPKETKASNNKEVQNYSQKETVAIAKNNLKNNRNNNNKNPNLPNGEIHNTIDLKETNTIEPTDNKPAIASNVITDKIGLGIDELSKKEDGVIIQSVTENSIASKIGLLVGDTVLQIGSFPIFNVKAYLFTLNKYKEGERAYYKVKRANGQTVMLNVEF